MHTRSCGSYRSSGYAPYPGEINRRLDNQIHQHQRTGEFVQSELTHTRRTLSTLQDSIVARRVLSALLAAGILTTIAHHTILPAILRVLRDHPKQAITAASIALLLNEYGITLSEKQRKALARKLRDVQATLQEHLDMMRKMHQGRKLTSALQEWARDNKERLHAKVQERRKEKANKTLNNYTRRRKLYQNLWTTYDSTA